MIGSYRQQELPRYEVDLGYREGFGGERNGWMCGGVFALSNIGPSLFSSLLFSKADFSFERIVGGDFGLGTVDLLDGGLFC